MKIFQPKIAAASGGPRQGFRTPPELFRGIARSYNLSFDLDVAASDENTLCGHWISQAEDALAPGTGWHAKHIWCNPPYNNIAAFVEKGEEEWRAGHFERGCFLLPARTETPWFAKIASLPWRIVFLTGRVRFLDPETAAPSRAPFEGSLLWFPGVKAGVETYPTAKLLERGKEQ